MQEGTEAKRVKVGIIGLGPVGLITAAHFKDAGCEVAVHDRNRIRMNTISREGISLSGKISKKNKPDHLLSSISDFAAFVPDYIIICVKAHQVESMTDELTGVLSALSEERRENLIAVSAQNGIDSEYNVADIFGESKTLRLVINYAGNAIAPNVVKVTFFNPPNYIASIEDSCPDRAKELAYLMNEAGLSTKAIDSFELLRRTWEKTILNASLSPLCGIGRITMKEAMDFPDTVQIVEQIIEEAVEVAAAEKIYFEDNFVRTCLRYLKKAGNHFPSMAGDIINNRPTEIDYMNGKIVEYGRKHYIRTSLNLVFTNMVKTLSNKNLLTQIAQVDGALGPNGVPTRAAVDKAKSGFPKPIGNCFIGVDLGSAYTKITVVDEKANLVFTKAVRTLNRDKLALNHVMDALQTEFPVKGVCATGYGRKTFRGADVVKTEINCAAVGVSQLHPGRKNVIDIGGEDIKIIRCGEDDLVNDFYLNDKCAAGTGAFLVEAAERADIIISDMSDLAAKSNFEDELNSFCTVFAKTEITAWLIAGKPIEDIARGIYVSIANRVAKLKIEAEVPLFMIGGVAAHHPFLQKILAGRYNQPLKVVENPQFIVSYGAALIAAKNYKKKKGKKLPEPTTVS